jgi:hypothetical protein
MNFKIKDVPGAGDCLFEAVGRSIGVDAFILRQNVVDFMKRENQKLHGEDLKDWIIRSTDVPLDESKPLQSYMNYIQRRGTWGGGLELSILSVLLQRPILVYSIEKSPDKAERIAEFHPELKEEEITSLQPICILYVGRSHYMQLIFSGK